MTRPKVYAHVRHLERCGLIEYEAAGRGEWATFKVNRDKLKQLYIEIAPTLKVVHGGTHGMFKPGQTGLPPGFSIYGFRTGPQVILDFKDLSGLRAEVSKHRKPVDPIPTSSSVLAEIERRLAEVLEKERLERDEKRKARATRKPALAHVT